MGTAVTKTETGLTCNSDYTRYIWAYNTCGNSSAVSLTQSTTLCCLTAITVNHIAGVVAPVTKSVTYGIVTNIPGEPEICWISRNLGASQQATAVNDGTEASAGWYWQFNRKQGYQYTTSRTPSTAWDATNDNLSATWEAAKDPCAIELGSGWRIPTYTEWQNVDAFGGWNDWNGPWNSALKLHAAGYLDKSNGALTGRGSNGKYWGSAQLDAAYGWLLNFNVAGCYMYQYDKASGYSVRCVRNY